MSELIRTKSNIKGEQARREILELAMQIASAEGLEGLTIGRLAGELSISKSGLFAHFGSKEGLQIATVEAAAEVFVTHVMPAEAGEPGLARLVGLMTAWAAYIERGVFRGGCFFAAAAAEFDDRHGPVRDRIADLSRRWLDRLDEEIQLAVRLGELSDATDSRQLAFELHATVQEANWAYRLLDDEQAFERARRAFSTRLLNSATARGKRLLSEVSESDVDREST